VGSERVRVKISGGTTICNVTNRKRYNIRNFALKIQHGLPNFEFQILIVRMFDISKTLRVPETRTQSSRTHCEAR